MNKDSITGRIISTKSIEERFGAFVQYNEETDCWDWTGFKRSGYGTIGYENKNPDAHRISYRLFKGFIPDGLVVRHKCIYKCVNPDHLELGSHQDNQLDRIRDNTHIAGENVNFAKLKEEDIKKIRENIPSTEIRKYCREQAVIYNVYWTTIHKIVYGYTWKHIL